MNSPDQLRQPETDRRQPQPPPAAPSSWTASPARTDPQLESCGPSTAPDNPDQPGGMRKPRRKLDPAMKEHICRLVAGGHAINSAALMVGVSPRTVHREKLRDPLFKVRLRQGQESVAKLCFKTMEAAAEEKWQAAERYYKLIYPERYYYKQETIPLKKHEQWTTEVLRFLSTVCTDEQMRQLDRLLNPQPKPKSPAA